MSQKNYYSKKTFLPVYEEWLSQNKPRLCIRIGPMNYSKWILVEDWAKWYDEHKEELKLCANEVFLPGCRLKVGFDLEQEGDKPFPEEIWSQMNTLIASVQKHVLDHLYAAKQLDPPQTEDLVLRQNVFRSTSSRSLGTSGRYKNSMHLTYQKIIATGPNSISYIQRYLVMVKDVLERELKSKEKLGHLQEWYYWKKGEAVKSLIDVDYIGGFKSLRILGSPKLKDVEKEGKRERVEEAPPLLKCSFAGVVSPSEITAEDFLRSLLTGPVIEDAGPIIDLTQIMDPPCPPRQRIGRETERGVS